MKTLSADVGVAEAMPPEFEVRLLEVMSVLTGWLVGDVGLSVGTRLMLVTLEADAITRLLVSSADSLRHLGTRVNSRSATGAS